jgi:hypothetical protein
MFIGAAYFVADVHLSVRAVKPASSLHAMRLAVDFHRY